MKTLGPLLPLDAPHSVYARRITDSRFATVYNARCQAIGLLEFPIATTDEAIVAECRAYLVELGKSAT